MADRLSSLSVLETAGMETRDMDAMVPEVLVRRHGVGESFGLSEFRGQAAGNVLRLFNVPDNHAAPVKPTILAALNADDAILYITDNGSEGG